VGVELWRLMLLGLSILTKSYVFVELEYPPYTFYFTSTDIHSSGSKTMLKVALGIVFRMGKLDKVLCIC
jgi:hypothetical protein